jgi:thiol-disulfide isomerase/thioredoxin
MSRLLKNLRFLILLIALGSLGAQSPAWVLQLKDLAFAKDVATARKLVESQRPRQTTITPEWLAGVAWLARGASFAGQWDVAEKYAEEALKGSQELLKQRSVNSDRNLEAALGGAIEVLGGAYNAGGDRAGAVTFLRDQHALYMGTVIETRIQKNILLLSLEGKPMPRLETAQYLGRKPRTAADLKGKVALFFFWAHWCSDCKRQRPILEQLHSKYADRGFTVVGPTRFWGYTAGGQDATPAQELDYLKNAYQQASPIPAWMDVPISTQNFLNFGVSSTPTLVLVDREGIVRLYNPGDLSHEDLAKHIERLLG